MENVKPTEILFTSPGTDISHQIIFSYWNKYKLNSSKKPLVYCSVLLNKFPFWKRLKIGLRYIFGKPSKFGYFDEFIFLPEDGYKLEKIANYLTNIHIIEYLKKYPNLTIEEIKNKIKEENESK